MTIIKSKENLAGAKPLGAGGGLSCPYVDKTKFINSYRLKKTPVSLDEREHIFKSITGKNLEKG